MRAVLLAAGVLRATSSPRARCRTSPRRWPPSSARAGIRVNSVAPSYIYEDVNKAYFDWLAAESGRSHDEIYAEKAAPTDLQRLASPDEVARATLFLATDLASAVSGQMLNVDCGEFHS